MICEQSRLSAAHASILFDALSLFHAHRDVPSPPRSGDSQLAHPADHYYHSRTIGFLLEISTPGRLAAGRPWICDGVCTDKHTCIHTHPLRPRVIAGRPMFPGNVLVAAISEPVLCVVRTPNNHPLAKLVQPARRILYVGETWCSRPLRGCRRCPARSLILSLWALSL